MKWNESLPNAIKLRFFSVIKTEIQPRSQNTPVAFGTPYREITYHANRDLITNALKLLFKRRAGETERLREAVENLLSDRSLEVTCTLVSQGYLKAHFKYGRIRMAEARQ